MLAIIQARCDSKRFRNKVLYDFIGKPIIWHIVNKLKKSEKISKIIVATSKNKTDDKLVKYLKKNKINFFRGSHLNVAKRLFDVAKKNNSKYFVRINADSPLIDPIIINKVISIHLKNIRRQIDLVTNVFPRTFPKGQSVEIVNTKTLEQNLCKLNQKDKEHVTRYFYRNYKNFLIK